MYPLALCSIWALAVSLERIWYMFRTRVDTEELMDELKLALAQGKRLEATQLLRRTGGPVAAVLAVGLAHADKPKAELADRIDQAAKAEVFRMEKGLPMLDSIVSISPLLGLLGTVTGIINSFRVLSQFQGLEGPAALSAGISEALITTAAGLSIAIPALVVYNWISSAIDHRVQEIAKRSNELLEMLSAMEAPRRTPVEGVRRA